MSAVLSRMHDVCGLLSSRMLRRLGGCTNVGGLFSLKRFLRSKMCTDLPVRKTDQSIGKMCGWNIDQRTSCDMSQPTK
eukprot:2763209-Amphidinium_carterae.1